MEQHEISHHITTLALTKPGLNGYIPSRQNNYSRYLQEQEINFSFAAPYLISGHPDDSDTWLIHISVIRQQFAQLIRPLLALLKSRQIPFAIPVDADQHSSILDGRSGFALTGKVITIIARPGDDVAEMVQTLRTLTKETIGPSIPCAYHLTNSIAVEYGLLFHQSGTEGTDRFLFYGSATANDLRQKIALLGIQWPFQNIRSLNAFKQPRLLKRQHI